MNSLPQLLNRGFPLLLLIGGFSLAGCTRPTQSVTPAWSTRTFPRSGISLSVPEYINAQEDSRGHITLVHAIPCRHSDPCDWRGDPAILSDLTDFSLTIQAVDMTITDTFLATFPKTGGLNVDQGHIRVEPGFIDVVEFGDWRGYRVESSCEGCGVYHYFFPSGAGRTIHLERKIITELRPNIEYERYAKLTGVIMPAEEQRLFESIVTSIELHQSTLAL